VRRRAACRCKFCEMKMRYAQQKPICEDSTHASTARYPAATHPSRPVRKQKGRAGPSPGYPEAGPTDPAARRLADVSKRARAPPELDLGLPRGGASARAHTSRALQSRRPARKWCCVLLALNPRMECSISQSCNGSASAVAAATAAPPLLQLQQRLRRRAPRATAPARPAPADTGGGGARVRPNPQGSVGSGVRLH